jgi:hypothetical protein
MKKLIALILILLSTFVGASEYYTREKAEEEADRIAIQENKTVKMTEKTSTKSNWEKIIKQININDDLDFGELRKEYIYVNEQTILFFTKKAEWLVFIYKNMDSSLTYWIYKTP